MKEQPSDRLEQLLEQWRADQHDRQIRVGSRLPSLPEGADRTSSHNAARDGTPQQDESELQELLETAQRLKALPTLRPGAAFSARLGEELQVRARQMRAQQRGQLSFAPGKQTSRKPFFSPGWMRVHPAWAAVAVLFAVFGLVSLLGVIGAQADNPSNPFYGVKLIEQDVQLSLASPADRVRLHLRYAQDALTSLQQNTAPQNAANYSQLLRHFNDELSQASDSLEAVPAGDEYHQLAQQLADLKATAQATLRGLLTQLTLAEQMETTAELGKLGAVIPTITSVTVDQSDGGKVTVVIVGMGFEPGAALLIDGQASDAATEVSKTQLKAVIDLPEGKHSATFGVVNPDGTVAQSGQITWTSEKPTPVPTTEPTRTPGEGNTPTPTPTPGGEGHGTPTPTPGSRL